MSDKHVVVVSNSSSGGSDEELLDRISERLSSLGEIERVEPGGVASFGDEVRTALVSDDDLIVAAGGDGTMNCMLNGFAGDLEGRTFALVPMGTGNDLARTLGIDPDPVAAAEGIVAGREVELDVGRASGGDVTRLFINACMGGFPVKVNQAIDGDVKERFGPLAFWVGGMRAAADLTRWRVTVDGDSYDDVVAIGVGNGKTAGGGITVWPDAAPGDGALDLCVLPAEGVGDALKIAASVKRGAHREIEGVVFKRAARFEISAEPELEFNCDGELIDLTAPVTFELVDRLRMRVPSSES
ncbi:MAG: diacylglycerol/lipid kinase family protein [Actinomycetota bacterium]